MQNPFTTTFSKMPDMSYIATESPNEIIQNFNYDNPSESVYKVTGVRGSGKTVVLAKVEEELRSQANVKKGWLVFDLNTTAEYLVTGKEPPVVEKIPADLQEMINKYAEKPKENDKKQKKDLTESKNGLIF